MGFIWADDDVDYIRSRSARYPGALDIDPEWTQEVLADEQLLEVTPYPRSRVGASGYIGWSPSANRVLVVIAYRDVGGAARNECVAGERPRPSGVCGG